MSSGQKVLVYGGKGALGSVIVQTFKGNNWWVLNVDLTASDTADSNVLVDPKQEWTDQATAVEEGVRAAVGKDGKLNAILCVAGGWAGGNTSSKAMVKNADLMWKQSVWSSVIAGRLASLCLAENGLLQLTGAVPSLAGTPGMMGYGMAKAAVHQFVASCAGKGSGLPAGATTLAILPVTLDTPMNRKWMAKADQTTWTPLEFVAEMLLGWSDGSQARPPSGTLVKLITKDKQTELINVELINQ